MKAEAMKKVSGINQADVASLALVVRSRSLRR